MKRISESTTDAVAFGRPYIANPDLPERFPVNAPLTEPNHETLYGGDEKGYTDYPFMDNGYDRIQ
jgi:N-ethylmaleimide reductase|tara:strand:+ start:32589 stop:32783 length:195 start_codon:yes stop_codon:yes gene_type:complete